VLIRFVIETLFLAPPEFQQKHAAKNLVTYTHLYLRVKCLVIDTPCNRTSFKQLCTVWILLKVV